jgi:hypothetical protein
MDAVMFPAHSSAADEFVRKRESTPGVDAARLDMRLLQLHAPKAITR